MSLNPGGPPYHGEDGTLLVVVLDGHKDVKLWGRVAAGVIRFERLEVVPADEITTDTLRAIPLGDIRVEVARQIRDGKGKVWMEPTDTGFRVRRFSVHAADDAGTRLGPREGFRGRPQLAPDFLRQVAERYLDHCARDEHPMKALVATYRSDPDQPDDLSYNTVKSWRDVAARRGWLILTGGRGKAGGEAGPLLVQEQEGREA